MQKLMHSSGAFAVVALVVALLFALAGCTGNAASGPSSSNNSSSSSNSSPADSSSSADNESQESQQGQAVVKINTEGMGEIAWSYENEEPAFDDEYPYQSAYVSDAYGQTIHIEARENAEYEGYRFAKWNKDGKKFSEEKRIDVPVDGDAEYVAVFEFVAEDGEVTMSTIYGDSETYTQEDIDAAVETVMAEFDTWKGASMKRIAYAGDATSADDLEYCNSLRAEGDPEFDQAIVFTSDFHSPSGKDAEGTAWEPDTDYEDYTWHLARTDGGKWKLLTWGY